MDIPSHVIINEEGPREGFQIEPAFIPTARKVELIDALSRTGLKHIQTVSFVPPKNVPGMADADAVVAGFTRYPGVIYTGMWLNEHGLHRAIATSKLDVYGALNLCASQAFLKRNQNRTMEENIQSQRSLTALYQKLGIPIDQASVSAAFGCNFEGQISPAKILHLIELLMDILGAAGEKAERWTLMDTMGWANPVSTQRLVGTVREKYPDLHLALHLHDTRGLGLANAWAGLQLGVTEYDTSVAGLGGCPFAGQKGAAGNVCTEDLVFMCEEMGISTGVDIDALVEAARLAEDIVGHPLPGRIMKAGHRLQIPSR